MENITAKIEKNTRKVYLSKSVIGNDGENLQEKLVFSFDSFVNGTARLELNRNNTQSYIMLTKVDNTYELPIRSLITKVGKLDLQLVITEGTNENEIPVFKSNVFFVIVNPSINAEIEEPEDPTYLQWIDVANEKLNEIDSAIEEASNLDITASKSGTTTTITFTDKDGETSSISILDGVAGSDGTDGITPTIGDNGNWYLGETDTGKPSRGIQGETGATGASGSDGVDGISPTVTTSKSGSVTTLTITDKNGEHTATINDGQNGTNGRDGYVQYTAGENITIENNVISATGGSDSITMGLIKTLYDDTYTTRVNFKKAKVGVYYNDIANANSSFLFVNSIADGADGSNQIDRVIFVAINKEISNISIPSSELDFGYAVCYTNNGSLYKLARLYVNTSGYINYTMLTVFKNISGLLNDDQSISGVKTFNAIPKLSSYSAPTQDTQLVAKKYVDDKIGDINTILATLTTPGGNE